MDMNFMPVGMIGGSGSGAQGPKGDQGSIWIFGTGNPDNDGGAVNDMYLQSNGNVWRKTEDGWVFTGINLKGDPGETANIDALTLQVEGLDGRLDAINLVVDTKADVTDLDDALVESKSYTDAKVASFVDSAPETLDTLNELAAALGNDPNFATTTAAMIGQKVDKVEGKGLSTNDFTEVDKNKLTGIEVAANNYVHPASHSAEMIIESTGRRFISDAELAELAAKETPAGAQAKAIAAVESFAVNCIATDVDSDPNTTNAAYIVSSHANTPQVDMYWHIQTYFYIDKGGNRAQIATTYYGGTSRFATRHIFGEQWSPWVEYASVDKVNALEARILALENS